MKHLSNFWRTLDMPLINYEASLILAWSKNCILIDMTTRDAEGNNPLSTQDDNNLLEQLKNRIKIRND